MDASPEALSSGGSLPPMLAERVMVIRRAADSADGVAEQLSEENSGPVVTYWMKVCLCTFAAARKLNYGVGWLADYVYYLCGARLS